MKKDHNIYTFSKCQRNSLGSLCSRVWFSILHIQVISVIRIFCVKEIHLCYNYIAGRCMNKHICHLPLSVFAISQSEAQQSTVLKCCVSSKWSDIAMLLMYHGHLTELGHSNYLALWQNIKLVWSCQVYFHSTKYC